MKTVRKYRLKSPRIGKIIVEKMRRVSSCVVLSSSERRKTMLKTTLGLLLFVVLMNFSVIHIKTVAAEEGQTARIFAYPSVIQPTSIGQNFTVNINVSDVVDLYAWQTGVTFNPNILECTGFYQGEFLRRTGNPTVWAQHFLDMNNTLGIIYYRGCCLLGPVPGVNGSGQLAYATFRSVGIGVSDFHLTDVVFLNSRIEDIPFEAVESLTVPINGTNYDVKIASNLTGTTNPENPPLSGVFDVTFSISDKMISFDANTMNDWFCKVSVPKELLRCNTLSEWAVRVDDNPVSYSASENATCTALYFGYNKGNHSVEISGTLAIGESPQNLTPPTFLIAIAALVSSVALIVALVDLKKTRSFMARKEFVKGKGI